VTAIGERGDAAMLANYPPRPLAFVRGVGCSLFDEQGVEHLDLVAGIAVVALGHAHPAPIEAFARQAAVLGHISNLYWSEPAVALAERLAELSGLRGGAFFCNSGAEANEALIKLARRRGTARGGPAKHVIVCLEDSFHGRTMGALAATWARAKKDPFEPLPAGFRFVPRNDVAALAAAVSDTTAGILLEPVQGETGVHPLDPAFLARARELADEHDALLLLDEVQTGIGRCGTWFAFQQLGVTPDAISLAKGLGSGVPIGAIVAGTFADPFRPGDHGTTFGGSPPVAAAALAVLDTIASDDLVAHAASVGRHLEGALRAVPGVADVRGLGLLRAIELRDRSAAAVADRLLGEHRVIVNAVTASALRICPPLVLSMAQADRFVGALAAALAQP
jgi:acetylornithine aminotransferase